VLGGWAGVLDLGDELEELGGGFLAVAGGGEEDGAMLAEGGDVRLDGDEV
jgi:hypothetical protein